MSEPEQLRALLQPYIAANMKINSERMAAFAQENLERSKLGYMPSTVMPRYVSLSFDDLMLWTMKAQHYAPAEGGDDE